MSSNILSDIRFALRMLRKNRSLTIAAVLTLALGIGTNTAIFSLVNAVLIQPLPYPQIKRIFTIHEVSRTGDDESIWMTRKRYQAWQTESQTTEIAALLPVGFNFRLGNGTHRVQGARVSTNFFSILGAKVAHGRLFITSDKNYQSEGIAVLDYRFWQNDLGSDPGIVGKTITIDNNIFRIVGILSSKFDYYYHQDVYIPLQFTADELQTPGDRSLHIIGVTKRGISFHQSQVELNAISRHVQGLESPTTDKKEVRVIPLQEEVVGDVRPALILFQVAVGFVLLIVCVNMTNLLLAHSSTRQKEVAVRIALGASRRRLIQQFFVESLLLTFFGGILGLALMLWSRNLLLNAATDYLPFTALNNIHYGIFIFVFIVSILTAFLIGLAPAFQFSKNNALLRSGDRISSGGKWRSVLVAIEIALSLVLLIGSGLMIKSFWRLQEVNPGFKSKDLLKLRIALPEVDYSDIWKKRAYYDEALLRLENIPGVSDVAMINWLPLSRISLGVAFDFERAPLNKRIEADCHVITPQYFQAMQIPVKLGRAFSERDNYQNPGVVIVTENFQRRYFQNQNPIGQRIKIDRNETTFVAEIVGVVGDVRNQALDIPPQPAIYVSYLQPPWDEVALREIIVKTAEPSDLAEQARKQLWAINPDVPVYQVQEMSQVVERSLGSRRFNRNLISFFGIIAVVLVVIGVYGLISYSVTQRTREIGVRMAFGAQRKDILKMIVNQGMKIAMTGVFFGIIAALLLTSMMVKLLFGVNAMDLTTFGTISLLIMIVVCIACYFPANRASKLNPLNALRHE
jgi:putative ABC transport system permease protein